MLLTFRDAIDSLVDYTGGHVQDSDLRLFRRAIRNAYNMFYQVHPWKYYQASFNIGVASSSLSTQMKFTQSTQVLSREFTVLTATPTSPIRITVESDGNLADGETITIRNATGDIGLNGTWVVSQFSSTEFDLVGSTTAGTYDAGSGAFNRGTFPSWTAESSVRIGQAYYIIIEKIDDYNLQVNSLHYPKQDSAGEYTLSIRHADLPADFHKMSFITDGQYNYMSECYVPPEEWLASEQQGWWNGTLPFQWTILPHPTLRQRYRLHFSGQQAASRNISFVYQRRLNDAFRWSGLEDAASSKSDSDASVDVLLTSTLILGTSTNFQDSMAGAVLRIGKVQDATDPDEPTGLDGINPYEEEHIIESVDSTTQITLETPISYLTSSANRQFVITDLIDLAPEHTNAFYRCAEYCYNILADKQEKISTSYDLYLQAVRLAMESDHKVSFYGGAVGTGYVRGTRDPYLTDFGSTISVP
jgi:hypothetical protein